MKSILRFLFAPKRFNRAAVEHRKTERAKHPVPHDERRFAESNLRQAAALRRALVHSFGVVLAALLLALLVGYFACLYLGPPSAYVTMGLQLFGAFILLGATLWQIRPEIESASRLWLAEQTHNQLFNLLYVTGTFLLGLAAAWDGFAK